MFFNGNISNNKLVAISLSYIKSIFSYLFYYTLNKVTIVLWSRPVSRIPPREEEREDRQVEKKRQCLEASDVDGLMGLILGVW